MAGNGQQENEDNRKWTNLWKLNVPLNDYDFIDWLSTLPTTVDKDTLATITAIIYQIWNTRNTLVFQNKTIPVIEALPRSLDMLQEFKDQNVNSSTNASMNNPCMQSCNISWSPPSKGFLKLNVDAHLLRVREYQEREKLKMVK